ncbi:MAG: glycosyltransferase family 4 protein [Fimbriimonadaceae bacterium]|nr:glycosyltransferase family 4 protein [Fimbriimonadaceae bacterium]QYK55305.1 MAG: glycosyltransferase family 4 protein [Fimbriimonadaceae bacterium]
MRVIMLSWEYPPRIVGGISPHVFDLSKELVKLGIEVHVVTKHTPLAPDEEIEPSGVHVHRVHLDQEPHNFVHEIQLLNKATDLRVRRLLEDWRPGGQPTLFHAHDWLSLDAARELKYEYQLPVVATVHATEWGRNNGIRTGISKYIHDQEYWLTYEAWRVIVCSQFMQEEVERYFSCPADKVDVIYNGVDPAKFEFDATAEEEATWRGRLARPDENIVMYVGRFVREKGIHILLNAASAVLAEEPNTKFVIVGGGYRENLERFVRWYGLRDKVLFTGFMANRSLHQLYRVADVAVFPSLYEPFGIVALEGMAAGCAVVASDAGGLNEVVLHDETGTSSYAGDHGSLAWAILRVLREPERAAKLKKKARARLDTDFNWENIARQTAGVYERVWQEFTQSYWVDRTLWPLAPGAEERAERLRVRDKALTGAYVPRPMSPVAIPESRIDPDAALAAGKTEEEERDT